MADALAAILDATLRPPRQGDADDGHGLVVDGDATDRWASLLATGEALFGRCRWWPPYPGGDVRTVALAALRARTARVPPGRPAGAPGRRRHDILRSGGDGQARRSGAAVTAARTASCRSPRTRTPTRCRSRSATTASTCSPTLAPTATTASPRGGATSGRRSGTTPSSSTASTSRCPAGRSCGRRPPGPACSRRRVPARSWSAEHDGYSRRRSRVVHRRSVRLDRAARTIHDQRRGDAARPTDLPACLPSRPDDRGRPRRSPRGCAGTSVAARIWRCSPCRMR